MSKVNDYKNGNLLDYDYFSKHYKLIAIDLNKQIELENFDLKQQIKFIGKLKQGNRATMFFSIENSEEKLVEIFINLLNDSSNEDSKFSTKKCVLKTFKPQKTNTNKQFY